MFEISFGQSIVNGMELSVVPKWRSVWSTVGWSTQRWDDVIMSHQNRKIQGLNNKTDHFYNKKTMTLTTKSWFSSSWTYVFTQEPVYRCIFTTFKSLREMKINNKTPLIRFKSVKPTCSIWRIRTILFVWSLWTILQAHLTVTSINLQPLESINWNLWLHRC